MTRSDELVVFLPSGRVEPPADAYGRLVANAGVLRALARLGGYRALHVQTLEATPVDRLAGELLGPPGIGGSTGGELPRLTTGSPLATAAPSRAGMLLSVQPYLSELAWARRHAAKDGAYSIAGTVFAFASASHREQMMGSALAPLHEWDALICSSPALEEVVRRTFDTWEDYLRERFGAAGAPAPVRLPRPQLPVVPFGVDAETVGAQADDPEARAAFRSAYGIPDADVVVYSLARLSFYDKAFPQAMFRAVEAAQRGTGITVHFVLAGWFPGGEKDRVRYEEAARRYAPGVDVLFVDGNDASVVAHCWAAADVFLLLSDTILETFGQALVEAMAAGLPLVVSDWDGYRSIARHGVDGFLVPTLGAPAGPLGETLALLESFAMANYPQYAGTVAQHTAVHSGRAAEALGRLLAAPELRASMGAAGRRRAAGTFSWPVIVRRYKELFAELTARRLSAGAALSSVRPSGSVHRMEPLRNDPFADFRGHPSAVLDDSTRVRLTAPMEGSDADLDGACALDRLFPGVRGTREEAERVVEALREAGSSSVQDVLQDVPPRRRPFVRMTLMWLAKAGVVDWLPPGDGS